MDIPVDGQLSHPSNLLCKRISPLEPHRSYPLQLFQVLKPNYSLARDNPFHLFDSCLLSGSISQQWQNQEGSKYTSSCN